MTALRPSELGRFIAAGCKSAPLILIYGPDEGGVRMRGRAIAATLLGDNPSPMDRSEFDAETLNADPGRLLDEANAIAMFGGKHLIVIDNAGKLNKSAWLPLLEVPPVDSTVLFLADELSKSAPIRTAFEQAPGAAVIACYPPSRQDVVTLIADKARAAGLAMTPAAQAYLSELIGGDFALAESEIDKLLLYCAGRPAVDVEDVDAMIIDSSDLAGYEPIDRAFEGKLEEIEPVALRSFREGINPSPVISMAIGHAIVLKRLASARESGGIDQAIRREGIFFRRVDRVRNQLSIWNSDMLTRAVETLSAAQHQGRLTPSLEETIAIRALWAIALASRRR